MTVSMSKRAAVLLAMAIPAAASQAAFISPALTGTTEYEGWANLTASNIPGYGSFPGAAPWPAPIASNEPGSAGKAALDKVSGNAYPAGSSIYAPFTDTTFSIESTAASGFDINTIVFQIDIGPGNGGVHLSAAPTLNYNGGSQALAADFTGQSAGAFPFVNPIDPTQAGTTTIFQFQWDLSGIVDNVQTYEIVYADGEHSQTYALQVDTGGTFVQAIPEPGSLALLAVGSVLVARRRRRA